MTPKLSIAIITYNEAANIQRTLESVAWADEIVVVDSGSADKTVEICRRYTDKVYHQEWLGFGQQKNLAIDKTSGEWILSLDADEPIEPALAEEIRDITSASTSNDGYRIPRKTFFLGKWMKYGGWYPDYNLRLFKKGRGRFKERLVHESIEVEGVVGNTKNAILHYAYPDLASYMQSINKYSSLAADIMHANNISAFQAGCLNILFRPAFTFVYKYFVRFGFLDGKHGLVLNLFHAYYVFAKYAKVWEDTIKVKGQETSGKERTNA